MSLEDFARVMQIVTGAAAIYIAYIVYTYNKRRDLEAIREKAWSSQQSLNSLILANRDVQKASEVSVSGVIDQNTTDEDIARATYCVFIQLNRVNLLWGGWRSKIIDRKVLDELARPTLWLYKGNEYLLRFCLSRGYSDDFVEYVNSELVIINAEKSTKPKPIKEFISEIRATLR